MTAPGQRSTLRDLEVLAVDCQATVGRPGSGFLLELAWVQTCAADLVPEEQIESAAEASLFRLPRGARIPPQVMKITGIRKEELGAFPPFRRGDGGKERQPALPHRDPFPPLRGAFPETDARG